MKTIGIWMDTQKAYLYNPLDDILETIASEVEDYHISGGSGTKAKGGPQDVVQDKKYLERKKQQLKRYFNEIVAALHEVDELVILGPAETPPAFYTHLQQSHREIASKVKVVQRADSMTENQTKALIREFFPILRK